MITQPYHSLFLLQEACKQLPVLEIASARITNESATYSWLLDEVYQ